jgi:hypothetical protein
MNSTQPQPNKFTYPLEIRQVETDVLFNTPDGWLKTNITYKRSKIYGGVIRALTLPIKYVNKGARLVRREFYKYGLLARVNQRILLNNPDTYENSEFFFGKLDFSKWSDEPTGVTINLIQNDINTQIAAYGDQEYSIPLTVPADERAAWIATRGYDPMVDILLTPLQLQEQADIIFSTSPDFRMNAFFQLGIADYQQLSVNASVKETGFLFQGPINVSTVPANGYYFFVAQTDTKIRISSPLDPNTGLPIAGGVQTSVNGLSGGGPAIYQFNIYNQNGTLLKTLAQTPATTTTVEFTFSFDFSLNVNKGDRLYFYIKNILAPTLDAGTSHGVNMQNGSMRLTYNTQTDATHCHALRPAYIFDYLIQKMNGTDMPAVVTQSRLLDGPLFQAAITCSNAIASSQVTNIYQAGESLRYGDEYRVLGGDIGYVTTAGLPHTYHPGEIFKAIYGHDTFTTTSDQDGFVQQQNNNPQLLYSYNEFFKTFYAVQCGQIGAGIDPTIIRNQTNPDGTITSITTFCMEYLRYWFRQTPPNATPNMAALDLGDRITADSPRFETAQDLIINGINGGYKNPQLTTLNGAKEVNAGVKYGTLVNVTEQKLEAVCPTNASCYAIEESRIQPGSDRPSNGLSGNFYLNSAASRSDNDNHFVWVANAPVFGQSYYIPLTVDDGCSSYSGVEAGFYNWPLSPMQNLLRGSNYLASVFDKMGSYKIYITGADKNTQMVTVDLNGRRVAEGEYINISDLGVQIFLPYYDTVTTGFKFNAEEMLRINPFGEIWYLYRGVNWKAFIQDVTIDCGQNTTQSLKGLLTPDNDLSLRVF